MKQKKLLLIGMFFSWVFFGCTNLDENVYSEISENNFYNSKLEIYESAMYPFTYMYDWLAWSNEYSYFYHNELSADQLAWPQKGRHGYDRGEHIRAHYHTWTTDERRIGLMWGAMYKDIGYTNFAISNLSTVNVASVDMTTEEMESLIAELKVYRAFIHMKLMDMFGNIPISTDVTSVNIPTVERTEVFNWVESEILNNIDKLQLASENLVGRVTKVVAYAMLTELYLNAEEWTGTARWNECITYCDQIISGEGGAQTGSLQLDENVLGPFNNTNHLSSENIYEVPFSFDNGFSKNWSGILMGFSNMSSALNVNYSGNNAFVVIPTAFDMFEEQDYRKQQWFLFGPQYEYGTTTPILGSEEYLGEPFIYVNNIRRNSEGQTGEGGMTDGEENSGARFHKYRSGTAADANYLENDFVVYRLTEIYFSKAEAIMRANGGMPTQEAVDLINESKSRYFSSTDFISSAYTINSLTLNELLNERGREFIFEGKRRTDLIRFGKFTTTSWWDKSPDGGNYLKLMPIPADQIAANPNLIQNTGY
ncbi:hypothetical protein NBRC110019_10630 [Neptunitalea chrysea]|uniref:RagB/SusD family nutrient uptake outer membrane protein n=1 Tax=Neptunitalea chrysea TaxID=1647581 RepID=A0A9W6EU20_9FLAO|nr:RagB/SusD family nutrient uptake outer membrane protein [Neptunitalea chrysea]GLB52024.1 hypothetical protein NBRC110019_10630 [Neptunitalea chrysea]